MVSNLGGAALAPEKRLCGVLERHWRVGEGILNQCNDQVTSMPLCQCLRDEPNQTLVVVGDDYFVG